MLSIANPVGVALLEEKLSSQAEKLMSQSNYTKKKAETQKNKTPQTLPSQTAIQMVIPLLYIPKCVLRII